MPENPKPFSVLKISFFIGISFAIMWMVMPPEKVVSLIPKDGLSDNSSHTDSIISFLRELSSELNATLPRRVNEEAMLETTMAGPGNRFTYFYTLLHVSADEISESQFVQQMAPVMKQRGINIGYLDDFFKDGTVVEFQFADLEGYPVGSFVITPEDAGY